MRLAIIHYHLRKGGVSRVIASALQALQADLEAAVVLSSTEPDEPLPCPVAVIPGLAYAREASAGQAAELHKTLTRQARRHLGGDPDIWHVHNHALGKNTCFPQALAHLIDDGARLLLQIHDFAEDGRPDNYQAQRAPYDAGIFENFDKALYPVAPQIAYAVLNGRDHAILRSAGIPDAALHWLPNAVMAPDLVNHRRPHEGGGGAPLILYPTRAIRRKNIGELLLLAATNPGFRFATTLAPKNPQWAAIHDDWTALAKELGLAVEFALGERPGQSFAGLMHEARALVTTSVGEGFGLAFLEPWLFGKPVTGRDLPEVTGDFKDNGIRLPDLYRSWQVPCRLFDADALKARFGGCLRSVYRAYQRPLQPVPLDAVWQGFISDDAMDFSLLDETAQAQVLRAVSGKRPHRLNSPVDLAGLDDSVISANAGTIRAKYGLRHYRKQLLAIYAALLEATPAAPRPISADKVLDAFLNPARLRLLRS